MTIDVTELAPAAMCPRAEPVESLDKATIFADLGFQDEMPREGPHLLAQALTDAAALVELVTSYLCRRQQRPPLSPRGGR